MSIEENVRSVKERITRAALACGRKPEEVQLVAASKMNDADRVRRAIAAGVEICGENRVQELVEKHSQGAYDGARLHFIGHLQKNKVRQLIGKVELIHGVDSLSLLQTIGKCASAVGLVQDVLVEVNIGGEASKSGISPEELDGLLTAASEIEGVRIRGLMTIPPISAVSGGNLPYFRKMHNLFIDNCGKKYDNVAMDFLSMGMSGDFEDAISCGANMVRVGTAIFGARIYPDQNSSV